MRPAAASTTVWTRSLPARNPHRGKSRRCQPLRLGPTGRPAAPARISLRTFREFGAVKNTITTTTTMTEEALALACGLSRRQLGTYRARGCTASTPEGVQQWRENHILPQRGGRRMIQPQAEPP